MGVESIEYIGAPVNLRPLEEKLDKLLNDMAKLQTDIEIIKTDVTIMKEK